MQTLKHSNTRLYFRLIEAIWFRNGIHSYSFYVKRHPPRMLNSSVIMPFTAYDFLSLVANIHSEKGIDECPRHHLGCVVGCLGKKISSFQIAYNI